MSNNNIDMAYFDQYNKSSKYGNFTTPVTSYETDIAALKEHYEKGNITKEEYNKHLSFFQRERMLEIVATNGGYTPSRKMMKKAISEKLSDLKRAGEAIKTVQHKHQFLDELSKQNTNQETEDTSKEEPKD